MKDYSLICALGLLSLLGCSSDQPITLFDVENKDGWAMKGPGNWIFREGEIIAESDSGVSSLITQDTYKNFELNLEFHPDSTINSGIFIQCAEKHISATACYEINIWDLHPNQEFRTGAVVTRASPLAFVETLNKWNTYRIRFDKNKLSAWVNGVQTVNLDTSELTEGYIGLQAAGKGVIRFRKVNIRLLPDQ